MVMFFIYILAVGIIVYFISRRGMPLSLRTDRTLPDGSSKGSTAIWKQVYETASMDEARSIQMRLEKERIDCILYEQGKKDIHGHPPKGVGVAVPNADAERAQECILKMPV